MTFAFPSKICKRLSIVLASYSGMGYSLYMETNTAATKTTLRNGQIVSIKGVEFAIERLDLAAGKVLGAWVMLAADYAKGRDRQMAEGFVGGYYTAGMIRAGLRDGSWGWQ